MQSKSVPTPDKQGWDKVKDRVGVRTSASLRGRNAMIPDPGHLRDTKGTLSDQERKFQESSSFGRSSPSVTFSKFKPTVGNLSARSINLSPRGSDSNSPRGSDSDSALPTSRNRSREDISRRHRSHPPPYTRPEPPLVLEDKSNITENPDINEIKSALAELQLKEANRELSELKKTKIDQKAYEEFEASLEKQGLKLDPGVVTRTTFTGKQINKTPTELLAGATIEYKDQINQAKILKTIHQQKKDIAYKMELRDQIMKDTGREFGPDIALLISLKSFKADILKADNLKEGETNINNIINENSSITEVLNVLAFLINKKNERAKSIISGFSVKGGIHDEEGEYEKENDIKSTRPNPDNIKTVFRCLNEGDESPFNIKTLQPYTPDESTPPPKGKLPPKIILPAGILKRKSDYTTQHFELTPEEIPKLFIACVLQMINLLQTTREVFGNWTKLFKGMNGGGSKSKSKKTRRRNRNRN
jgi:hypothetical protein